ncbi:MAG: RNA polymerase sigma factor [Armatimonadota bacterium]
MSHAACPTTQSASAPGLPPALARLLLAVGEDRSDHLSTPQADALDVRRSLDGDEGAFRRLIARHQERIASMMWRFSRDRATHEELVQEVFIEAWTSLDGYRAEAPFEHWLSRIATRVGYRHWREAEREGKIVRVPLAEHPGLAAPEELEPPAAGELLHRLLQDLSPRDRLVLTLRYLEEKTVKETAELTGWSESMVKVQAHRARGRLQKLFERAVREAEETRKRP